MSQNRCSFVDSIAVSVFADIFIELTNTVSDVKIQITILILRRGALSNPEKFKLAICFGLATFLCYAITFGALMAIWWNGGEEVCRPGAGGGQAAYWCRPLSLDTKTIWKYFR